VKAWGARHCLAEWQNPLSSSLAAAAAVSLLLGDGRLIEARLTAAELHAVKWLWLYRL
jgi:hypothetical protein